MGAELFHGERRTEEQDRRTDKHDEGNRLFRNFANVTKKGSFKFKLWRSNSTAVRPEI